MKYSLFILAVLQFTFPGEVNAQPLTRTQDCISIADARDMRFTDGSWGVVSPGVFYVITPTGFKEPPGPGEGAGILVDGFGFEIRGMPGADVTVHVSVPDAFVSEDSTGFLPLSWWTYGWAYDEYWPCPGGGQLNGDSVIVSLDSNGARMIYFGAMVTVPITATPVFYRAQIKVSYPGVQQVEAAVDRDEAMRSVVFDTVAYRSLQVVGITDAGESSTLIARFALHPNYPNPFNPATTISYDLPAAADVRLSIFNVVGQEVAVLVKDRQAPGHHSVAFDAGNLPSGVYACRIAAGTFADVKMMLLMK